MATDYGKHCGGSLKKNRVDICSSILTPGNISGQNYNSKSTCAPMFIAVVFTIAKTWKQPKCPSTDEWTKKT